MSSNKSGNLIYKR